MISTRSRLYTFLIIFTAVASLALHIFPAFGLPSYGPGVKPGDEVTYGHFNVTNHTAYQIFPANVTNLQLQINTVNTQTKDISASLVYSFENGTQQTSNLFGNTNTGSGNTFPWLVAANLTAGDALSNPLTQTYPPYVFNETVQREYAGAIRTVNVFNLTDYYVNSVQEIDFTWDQQTGVLLEAFSYSNFNGTSPESYSVYFEATSTNIWSPSTSPEFTLDASPVTSEVLHAGDTVSFLLSLSSFNSFSGKINLTATPTVATPNLSTSLNPSAITLTSGSDATASLQVATSKTIPVGLYTVTIDGTSTTTTHQALLLIAVSPPDFILTASPSNLTLAQGTNKTTTITATGRGGFTGTLTLAVNPYYSGQLNVNLGSPFLTLNMTTTSATTVLTADATDALPGPSGYLHQR